MKIDPWSEDAGSPPRWAGQQAGCGLALAVGVLAVALFGLALAVMWFVLNGS